MRLIALLIGLLVQSSYHLPAFCVCDVLCVCVRVCDLLCVCVCVCTYVSNKGKISPVKKPRMADVTTWPGRPEANI